MKIIPVQPATTLPAAPPVRRLFGFRIPSRRTFAAKAHPSRRTFGTRAHPSRRTFAVKIHPSRRTFSAKAHP